MMTSDYGHTYFIHKNNVVITITRDAIAAAFVNPGWKYFEGYVDNYAVLDIIDIPALPYLCQSTIDAMDQDADALDFGRYS